MLDQTVEANAESDPAMLGPVAKDSCPGPTPPLRVLFLERGGDAAQMRLRPLLDLLRAAGQIGGYAVVDRDLSISGDVADDYDVVLAHRIPSGRQLAWLRRTAARFAYDIDDLLLPGPDESWRGRRASDAASVAWRLRNARHITAPSRRLLATLERRLGASIADRAQLLLNAGVENPPLKRAFGRPRLLWTSSAVVPVTDDVLSACQGIDAALRAIGTDILLVGRFAPGIREQFSRSETIAWLPPDQYRKLLAEGPFIGVRPLPTGLPADQQAFIDCKSDIRAAEYGSSGIEAVYSPLPPYTESDLPCRIAPTNRAEDWRDAVLAVARGFRAAAMSLRSTPHSRRGGRAALCLGDLYKQAVIIGTGARLSAWKLSIASAARAFRLGVIAREFLAALSRIGAAATPPVRFRALPTPALFRNIERGFRGLRSRLFR